MNSSVGVGGSIEIRKVPGGQRSESAPWRWRLKSLVRLTLSGELFLPAWLWLLRLVLPRGVAFITAELYGVVIRADGSRVELGLLGRHLVTTAGKNFIASAFNNVVEPETMRYHGFGSGTTAAAAGDTALQTEFTTQYATDNTRPTGSQSNTGATYTTVATFAPDSLVSNTEWGLFNQAATGGGTMLDRQVYTAYPVEPPDTLQITYILTVS